MAKKKTTKKKTQKKTAKKKRGRPKKSESKKKTEPQDVAEYPDASKTVGEFEKQIDLKLNTDTGEKKRGRPTKESQQKKEQTEAAADAGVHLQKDTLAKGCRVPFALWAEGLGPDAPGQLKEQVKLSDPEAQDLADSLMPLLAYYAPNMPAVAMLWGVAGLNVFAILQPRISAVAKAKAEKRKKQEAEKKAAAKQNQIRTINVEKGRHDTNNTGPNGFPKI
jgi:hypothetical protein